MVIVSLTLVQALPAALLAISPGRDWPVLLVAALLVTILVRRQLGLRSRQTSAASEPLLVFQDGGIEREKLPADRLPRLKQAASGSAGSAGAVRTRRAALPGSLDGAARSGMPIPGSVSKEASVPFGAPTGRQRSAGVFRRNHPMPPGGVTRYEADLGRGRSSGEGPFGLVAGNHNGTSEEDALTVQLLPGSLTVVEGVDRGTEIRFVRHPGAANPEFTLGRAPNDSVSHIQVRGASVSRTHARVRYLGDTWEIANLSATNPARVNGVGLGGPGEAQRLNTGDIIELGEVVLRYQGS